MLIGEAKAYESSHPVAVKEKCEILSMSEWRQRIVQADLFQRN